MRRTLVLVAGWLLAAGVAVAVAWQGVAVVGDQVTDQRPAPLAAAEIEERLAASTTSTVPGTSSTTPGTSATSVAATGGTAPTSALPPATTPTTAPVPAGETRTYNLVGGTAALTFTPQGVTVVFATPADGFSVSTEPENDNGVKVEFESSTHESRVDGWWDGGPVDRVREESED